MFFRFKFFFEVKISIVTSTFFIANNINEFSIIEILQRTSLLSLITCLLLQDFYLKYKQDSLTTKTIILQVYRLYFYFVDI